MPKSFSDHERGIIRSRLLQEGNRLFSTYGLRKTSVEEIALSAKISKGAFYLFFPSKESLFMEVVEEAEKDFRLEILTIIDQPGGTPHARLHHALTKAFSLWQSIPILQQFNQGELEYISRRVPPESIEQHTRSDMVFAEELVQRCLSAGIRIKIDPEEVRDMLYIVFFSVLHKDDLGEGRLEQSINTLLELLTSYFLGEVNLPDAK